MQVEQKKVSETLRPHIWKEKPKITLYEARCKKGLLQAKMLFKKGNFLFLPTKLRV